MTTDPVDAEPSKLADVTEAAAAMGCTKQTIYNLVARGDFPTEIAVRRVGRNLKFPRHQLEAWCNGQDPEAQAS